MHFCQFIFTKKKSKRGKQITLLTERDQFKWQELIAFVVFWADNGYGGKTKTDIFGAFRKKLLIKLLSS